MPEIRVNNLQQKYIVNQAAQKYGVPYGILAGVYGIETTWGKNTNTSSAGAIGPFQFLPSTAAQYGYPVTNSPTPEQFVQQTDAAARYLADLFHQHGNWDAALRAYSGGGYGYSQVSASAVQLQRGSGAYSGGGVSPSQAILGGSLAGIGTIAAEGLAAGEGAAAGADATATGEAAGAGAGGALGAASTAAKLATKAGEATGLAAIAAFLTSTKNWLRIGEVIAGLILIAMGLRTLSGTTSTPITVASGAAKTAAKAAVL